jgi:DNA gyrase subunit A
VENIVNVSTHDYILFFTTKGRVFRIKGYEIPEYGRQSKGLPIVNLLNLEKDEKITSLLKIEKEESSKYLIFATKFGLIKRTDISEFDSIRNNGKKAITLKEDDELISVKKTSGSSEILMCSSNGRMVRFNEDSIRVMGRGASGVRGINLDESILINMDVVTDNQEVLVITKNGYGKKTPIEDYRITSRGGKGVKTLNVTDKNGDIVSFEVLNNPNKDVMIITNEGIIIRIDSNQISTMSRVTQGVRLINLKGEQIVSSVAVIDKDANEDILINDNNNIE